MRLFSLVALLATAAGFVPVSMWYSDPGHSFDEVILSRGAINRLWNLPTDVTSTDGFSSGISYAWDPELCDNLLPLFSEDINGINFITCDSLRAAWSRALSTWSVHHPQISFTDVTAECERAGDLTGGPVNGEGCSFAQMWVTTKSNSTGADNDDGLVFQIHDLQVSRKITHLSSHIDTTELVFHFKSNLS